MTSPTEANLPLTSELYELIERTFQAITLMAVIIASFLILDTLNGDDDGPDGYT